MIVRDCMTPDPLTIRPDESVGRVASLIQDSGIHQVPVVVDGQLVGIVTDRDLRVAWGDQKSGNGAHAADVMSKQVVSVTPDTHLSDAVDLLRDGRYGALPVIEDGKLVGMLGAFNLLTELRGLLDEVHPEWRGRLAATPW